MTLAVLDARQGPLAVLSLGENTLAASVLAKRAAASAAYAESMTGPTYASTAAGLADASDGEGFAVDNGDGTVTVYINDGGSAVEQRTLATTAALASPDDGKGTDLVAGAGKTVSSRAAMAALVAPADKARPLQLTEAGGEGTFVWDGSDLSAKVAADAQKGIYVAPANDPTGASGAWVRKYDAALSPSWFGSSSTSTAAQKVAALNAAKDFVLSGQAPDIFVKRGRIRPEMGGAVGNGAVGNAAINKAAIEAAAAFAVAEKSPLSFDRGADYAFDTLFLPAGVELEGTGWSFQPTTAVNNSNGTVNNNGAIMLFGNDLKADEIHVVTRAGHHFDRLIELGHRSRVGSLYIEALSQVLSSRTDKLDGSVRLNGSDCYFDSIRIKNHDLACVAYLTDRLTINELLIESYIRGLYARGNLTMHIGTGKAQGSSPSYSGWNGGTGTIIAQAAGQNAFLFEGNAGFSADLLDGQDAGEHAIRLGEDSDKRSDFAHFDYNIGRIKTRRSGQCGFKCHPGKGLRAQEINIGKIDTVDCAWANTAGPNEDAVRLEEFWNSSIGQITVVARDQAVSCYDGLYVSECNNVVIGSHSVYKAARHGIHVESYESAGSGNGYSGDTNNFRVLSGISQECGGAGVYINGANQVLRDLHVLNYMSARNTAQGFNVINASGSTGVNQPCVMDGWSYGNGVANFFGNDPDVKNQVVAL